MIRYITLKNFRAYENQRFDFSRINVFMGPNNSGKSSALSALNLLAQTFRNRSSATSPLELNGVYESLGTYIDVVHNNGPRSKIGIEIGLDRYDVSLEFKYRSQRREIDVTRFYLGSQGKNLYSYRTIKDGFDARVGNINTKTLSKRLQARPRFQGYWPYIRNLPLAAASDIAEFNKVRQLYRSISLAESHIAEVFKNYDALSPFRAPPERTYLYSGESPESIGRNGINGVNMLVNDASKRGRLQRGITAELNNWFHQTGIAQEIRVKNLTPRHFEIVLSDFRGREHNICDVGFGCSQVLPVLIGGLNLMLQEGSIGSHHRPVERTYVVQEPEIHLHPNAQAALGSYFVSLANMGGQIFLETHSDHLVLRLARHVARGEISPSDVNIYYIKDQRDRRETVQMRFDNSGAFTPSWPGGFFPQRQNESLALARDRTGRSAQSSTEQLAFNYL